MRRIGYLIISATFAISIFFCTASNAAEVRDGFEAVRRIDSQYFDIYIENGVDLQELTLSLIVPPSIAAIVRDPATSSEAYSLTAQLDLFFLAISEILDIRLKNFKCKIKICRDSESLAAVGNSLFGRSIQIGGFYVSGLNALYLDGEGLDINILGHELSHAIQCNYFVIPPPAKIQEVLSGYVEFQLRKHTNSLPN